MKKKFLLKSMLLLCALIAGSGTMWADSYEKVTSSSNLVDGGEYILACTSGNDTYVVTAAFSSNTFSTTSSGFSVSSSTITISTASPMVITLGIPSSGNYTLSYVDGNTTKYIGHLSNDNKLTTGTSASTDYYKWTWNTSNYALINKGKTGRYIGYNGSSGVKSYSTQNYSTYPIACLYKKVAAATALEVKTAPTKVNYKVGEKLDLTGLVLDATVGGKHVDVTSGYTAKIGETAVTSGTTVLNEVGAKTITFTYGGQSCEQIIHVGQLEGIAITTAPTKTSYDEGQSFNPSGMVITATYSDKASPETTWTATVPLKEGEEDGYTYSPSSALTTSNTSIEVSYTWGNITKTANQTITVTAGVPYTVTFNAGTGSCGTASLTEASFGAGVTLPTATIGLTGWSFAGWATASIENTEVAPTLYTASSTYKPTDNITLYAVYTLTDIESGVYKRATSVSDITQASSLVIVSNSGSKLFNSDISSTNAPTETEGKITVNNEKAVFTIAGNDTNGYTLTNGDKNVGTTSTDNSTAVSMTSTNNLWKVNSHNTDNCFYFENTAKASLCLEYYSGWLVYAPSTPSTNSYVAMKVYIPSTKSVYNSNPAAIINPSIAFTTAGDKNLYVQDESSYTNAANVTGISKTPVYSSSDETVATVSDAGVVTALKAGSTTITAKVLAEAGVNTEASVSYNVTVKDAKSIAGLKAITDGSTAVNFTADLTDAVVTYVNGSYAYIQDASGAVYASCGSSLTAGKKINGAVTGSIKAAYKIDEITVINLDDATVTDGVIPAALTKTVAELITSGTSLEGQLVQVGGATVTSKLESGSASGGKITDDAKVSEINLYAPASNINALEDAEGTFTGFISYYNNSTYRLNIYEQSQITLTKNAPTDQALSFENDAVELDEETPEYTDFTGLAVSGAQGTVTYSIESDDDGVVTSINSSTGAVVLSGNCGTATIKASAAAKEVTVSGVTTPYKATTKTYTITVYPRYTSTFNVNGAVTEVRQATHDAEIAVPTPAETIGDYYFMGWKADSGIDTPTDVAPTMVTPPTTPTSNVTYYAVYAQKRAGGTADVTSTLSLNQTEPDGSTCVVDGVTWTWNNVYFDTTAGSSGMKASQNAWVTFELPTTALNAKSISLSCSQNKNWGNDAVVVLKAGENELASLRKGESYTFTSPNNTAGTYTMSQTTAKNAWINAFELIYTVQGVENYGYCTTLPLVGVNVAASGYTTYASVYALDFANAVETGTENRTLKAYVVSDVSNTAVTLTEVTSAPASTGVVLKGTASTTYNIPVTSSPNVVGTNKLTAVVNATTVEANTVYVVSGGLFCLYTGTAIPAGKAYLHKDYVPANASMLDFDFSETTGVNDIRSQIEIINGDFYDMQGRKVAQPTKGLYIVNGHKVVVK